MNPAQPPLSDLLARYLERQASACEEGLDLGETCGEVVPFDAVPVQPVEPRLAWGEGLEVLHHFKADTDTRSLKVPPDWPALVATREPEVALPFCLGNFPQMVRHLPALLQVPDPAALPSSGGRPLASLSLLAWAEQAARKRQYPQTLLAAGLLRLARQLDAAADLLHQQADVPAAWRTAWANEEAALAWHRGQQDEAITLWNSQPESVPVLFNRGMAALFLNRSAEARSLLSRATAQLPEDGAWHHLGRLYLALAEMRG